MSRMLKALQNLAQQGGLVAPGRRGRAATTPRMAAPLRTKASIDSPTSVPEVLFSAPGVATREDAEQSIVVRPGFAIPSAAEGSFERRPMRPVVAPGTSVNPNHQAFADLGQGADAAVVRPWSFSATDDPNNPTFGANASFVWNGPDAAVAGLPVMETKVPEPVVEPVAVAPPPEPEPIDTPPVVITPRPSVWELGAVNELADAVRRNHFAELLRTIRRDVPPSAKPCVGFCGVENSRQTAETVLRIALVAAEDKSAKVLLIDANQIEPRITDALDLTEAQGLVDFASGPHELDRLVRPTSHSRISVLSLGAGTIEHLGNARARLATLVQLAKGKFSTTLVDLGPMSSPLAALVGSALDGAYVSVNLGATVAADAERHVKRFQRDGVRLFGCVVLQPAAD